MTIETSRTCMLVRANSQISNNILINIPIQSIAKMLLTYSYGNIFMETRLKAVVNKSTNKFMISKHHWTNEIVQSLNSILHVNMRMSVMLSKQNSYQVTKFCCLMQIIIFSKFLHALVDLSNFYYLLIFRIKKSVVFILRLSLTIHTIVDTFTHSLYTYDLLILGGVL